MNAQNETGRRFKAGEREYEAVTFRAGREREAIGEEDERYLFEEHRKEIPDELKEYCLITSQHGPNYWVSIVYYAWYGDWYQEWARPNDQWNDRYKVVRRCA